MPQSSQALVFDLDGTLMDSVYQHVLAWHAALRGCGVELSLWRIHRRIGMSGGLFVQALLRETHGAVQPELLNKLRRLHDEHYDRLAEGVVPLTGTPDLLRTLTTHGVPWAIATSGRRHTAERTLQALEIPESVPVVTRSDVARAKPNPDLFVEAARRLEVAPERATVVGDSLWDLLAARQARMLGVGLLSGGYGKDELEQAGAYRVYEDPADLLRHLDELCIRLPLE